MSIKSRVEKLEILNGGGPINFAVELGKLEAAERKEAQSIRQMLMDGKSADEIRLIMDEREQAHRAEQKAECERIISENNNPALVSLAKAELRAMECRP